MGKRKWTETCGACVTARWEKMPAEAVGDIVLQRKPETVEPSTQRHAKGWYRLPLWVANVSNLIRFPLIFFFFFLHATLRVTWYIQLLVAVLARLLSGLQELSAAFN